MNRLEDMKSFSVGKATVPLYDYPNIGISVSGGADSAALLYILMTHLPNSHFHIYTFSHKVTSYYNLTNARFVTMRCSELTGFKNYTHHVGYTDQQTLDKLFQAPADDFHKGVFDIFYTGITANPDKEIADGFLSPQQNKLQEKRDPTVTRSIMLTDHTCTPFTNLNKQDMADIYRELNIFDSLFPYTRSCESDNPAALGTHCGICWWCKEREWGFGRL